MHTLGISSANLPEQIVESDDAFRAPLLFCKIKYGIPWNFDLEGQFKTNIITLYFSLGPKWTHELDRFSFSLGTDAAYYYGTLDQVDFKSSIEGLQIYPNLTLGYLFPKFSVSLKSEILLIMDQSARTGDEVVTSSFKTFSGYSFTTYIEQPLWKENFFVIGFRANYVRFFYPMWITFSTFDRFFFIPEVIFSFNL
jgi:hypothetical protein